MLEVDALVLGPANCPEPDTFMILRVSTLSGDSSLLPGEEREDTGKPGAGGVGGREGTGRTGPSGILQESQGPTHSLGESRHLSLQMFSSVKWGHPSNTGSTSMGCAEASVISPRRRLGCE